MGCGSFAAGIILEGAGKRKASIGCSAKKVENFLIK
jgi:hypothetical protein